jgi:arginyl-tRNA--protein-N-Asp/Glu arginylyltransferase
MHPTEPPFLRIQFYLTAPYACSYLEGLEARSQVAAPAHLIGPAAYSQLIREGFRRSGHYTYRPYCLGCKRCVPVRIDVKAFLPNRSQRRCLRQNPGLKASVRPLEFCDEHFELYRRYQHARHKGGGMDLDDSEQYMQFLLSSQVNTSLVEFRDGDALVMVAVIDRIDDGLSAVYTFFDPEMEKHGLGTYAVLWQIELARSLGLPYVYLGYWIKESRKMSYKSNYKPLQGLVEGRWTELE